MKVPQRTAAAPAFSSTRLSKPRFVGPDCFAWAVSPNASAAMMAPTAETVSIDHHGLHNTGLSGKARL